MMLKLWKISQSSNSDYDTYDSAVVVAATEADARKIHPSGPDAKWEDRWSDWCASPDLVGVSCVGDAAPGLEAGTIIVASFNAG